MKNIYESAGQLFTTIVKKMAGLIASKKDSLNTNHVFDFLDNIYVVHFAADSQRYEHFTTEFRSMGISQYEVIEAFDSKSPLILELQLGDRVKKYPGCFRCGAKYCDCQNNVLIRQQVANWMSFLKVFEDVITKNYKLAMVCEDDVKFTEYASEVIDSAFKNETIQDAIVSGSPLLIRLGYPGFDKEVHSYQGNIGLSDVRNMSNSCFVFNLEYAKHIFSSLERIEHTSDVFFHILAIGDTVKDYSVVPPPCYDLSQSKQIHSRIHPKNVDDFDVERGRLHVKRLTNKIGAANVFGGNFGDLLGPYIYQRLTGVTAVPIAINDKVVRDAIQFEHYLTVGSILKHTTSYAKIWGIGIMDPDDTRLITKKLNRHNVYAVRGRATLSALINSGLIDPEAKVALGDPALLLPLLYDNRQKIKYEIGIIPHCTEYENVLERFRDFPKVHVIRLGGHESHADIENTINLIRSCESVVSSSLHGLVVAHAYAIPAAWVKFTEITISGQMGTGNLKYFDYFSSLDLDIKGATICSSPGLELPASDVFTVPDKVILARLQADLLESCPFNVHGLSLKELRENNIAQLFLESEKSILDYLKG